MERKTRGEKGQEDTAAAARPRLPQPSRQLKHAGCLLWLGRRNIRQRFLTKHGAFRRGPSDKKQRQGKGSFKATCSGATVQPEEQKWEPLAAAGHFSCFQKEVRCLFASGLCSASHTSHTQSSTMERLNET